MDPKKNKHNKCVSTYHTKCQQQRENDVQKTYVREEMLGIHEA